jgi:DNA-directed RNA polymerase specialized sigma24 family protein
VKPPFESVVAGHGATVLRVLRAVLGHSDADDAWSDTFLAAMKAYPDLPADANVEAWLVTIAHRKAIDVIRATARRAAADGIAALRRTYVHDKESEHEQQH